MQIILNEHEENVFQRQAKDMDVPVKILKGWYFDTMEANFEQDVYDIINENYNEIMAEAKGPDYESK